MALTEVLREGAKFGKPKCNEVSA